MRVWQAHNVAVLGLAFAPDGGALATAGDGDPAARVWDLAAGGERCALSLLREPALGLAFAPDGQTLAVARPEAVELWDPVTGEQRYRLDAYRHHSNALAFAADGRALLSAGTRTSVPVSVEEELLAVPGPLADPPPGVPLAGAVQALVWDPKSRRLLDNVVEPTGHALGLVCAPDARTVLWSHRGADEAARHHAALIDVPARRLRAVLDPPGALLAAALAPDGRVLAAAVRGDVHLWAVRRRLGRSAPPPEPPRRAIHGAAERIDAVAFTPDGRRLLAGTARGTVRVWDVPDLPPPPPADALEEPAPPPEAHVAAAFDWRIGRITALAVAPDGLTAAAGGADGRVVVWDLDA